MTEKEITPFKRIPWNEYKERLISFGYTQEQTDEVFWIRENPEIEEMTWEQFRFLFLNRVLRRTRKLKKIRTLYVFDDKVWYLDHHVKGYRYCAEFINAENE